MNYPSVNLYYGITMLPITEVSIQGQPVIENETRTSTLDMLFAETILSDDTYAYYFYNFLKWLCRDSNYYPNPLAYKEKNMFDLTNRLMTCPCSTNTVNGIPNIKFKLDGNPIGKNDVNQSR